MESHYTLHVDDNRVACYYQAQITQALEELQPPNRLALFHPDCPASCKYVEVARLSEDRYQLEVAFGEPEQPPSKLYQLTHSNKKRALEILTAYFNGEAPDVSVFADASFTLPHQEQQFFSDHGDLSFPDQKLQIAINLQLGRLGFYHLNLHQMQNLRSLKCRNAWKLVESYHDGLRGARSTSSTLDIEPLALATQLRTLDLSENEILDFTPLSSCTELTSLQLNNTNLRNLDFLLPLKKLSTLFITSCKMLENVDALEKLSNLHILMIDPESVKKFHLIERLPNCSINPSLPSKKAKGRQKQAQGNLRQTAENALRKQDWKTAIDCYSTLLHQEPSYGLYNSLALCYKMQREFHNQEKMLEQGFLLEPTEQHLRAIFALYQELENNSKLQRLATVCRTYGILLDDVKKLPQKSGAVSGNPHEQDPSFQALLNGLPSTPLATIQPVIDPAPAPTKKRSLLDWIKALFGFGTKAPKKAAPPASESPQLHPSEPDTETDEDYFNSFFYNNFTRVWKEGYSMRPVYRGEMMNLIQCATRRQQYSQQEGEEDVYVHFPPQQNYALFDRRGKRKQLSMDAFYQLCAAQVERYLGKYYITPQEKESWQQALAALYAAIHPQISAAELDSISGLTSLKNTQSVD
ncbi:MAG: leucine-rich repeat domain-containing protein [Anaerotruncus sp.]|nr:leucine-rich repeat domain-containing protein [Anaerotruncus sp.]